MTKLTTESLEKFVNDIKTDGMCDITDSQVALALRQLLAYEQATKNPVAWDYEWASYITCEGPQDFNRIIEREAPPEWAVDEGQAKNTIPLYAAPVLPKQPELVENLKKVMNNWLAMEPKLAFQPEFTDVMMLLDAEAAPAQPVIPEQPELVMKHSSVIAEQLAHVLSGMDVNSHNAHQRAVISCAIYKLNKTAEILQQKPTALIAPERLDYQSAKELFNYLMNEEETNATVNGWNACRAEMLKAQPVSEPYKLPVGYFSYGSECGFDWHNTEKEAIEAAEAVIDNYRGDACDGWSEETDSVCWGVILQQATKVDERPRTDDDKCDPAIDTVCDYALLPALEG